MRNYVTLAELQLIGAHVVLFASWTPRPILKVALGCRSGNPELRMYCKGCISFNFSNFFIAYILYRKKNYMPFPPKKIKILLIQMTYCETKYHAITAKKIAQLDDVFGRDLHFSHLIFPKKFSMHSLASCFRNC